MATTNYNLPTISGASPVAIVDDYNALANATDAALAGAISGEKTRAMAAETELANGVSNALTTANSANVSATNAQTTANAAQDAAASEASRAQSAETVLANSLATKADANAVNQAMTYTYAYVANYGSDSNDGLSPDTPLKTLDAALALVDKGFSTLDINLLSASNFTCEANLIANCALHISSDNGATVSFVNQVKMYNAYLNFSSSNANGIVGIFSGGLHVDGSSVYSNNANLTINSRFDVSFGAIYLEGTCTITSNVGFVCKASTLSIASEATVTWNVSANVSRAMSFIEGSIGALVGVVHFVAVSNFTGNYIFARASQLIIQKGTTDFNVTSMSTAITLGYSFAVIAAAVYSALESKISAGMSNVIHS